MIFFTRYFSFTGSSSSTPYSTPRQPLAPPMSLPPFSGSQASYRSPQTSLPLVRALNPHPHTTTHTLALL